MTLIPPAHPALLSSADQAALTDLYIRGTPQNTLRAYERDLRYITAWKAARFGSALSWPESEEVGLRFIVDHARDLFGLDPSESAREAAQALIAAGLRRTLACPAPATLDRRIASWRAFHRMKNLPSPFEAPVLRQARARARRAAARSRTPKSVNPILRDSLQKMVESCGSDLRGLRDRAVLLFAWASGGRRRSEIVRLEYQDLQLEDFDTTGVLWIQLSETKTTAPGKTPRLVLKGAPAQSVAAWIEASGIEDGPLFRPISKSGRVLTRGLSADGIYHIVKSRLRLAGLSPDFASPHGLRSGFLTQAALDGIPVQIAMQLSLHTSLSQASAYYADVDLERNEATDLF